MFQLISRHIFPHCHQQWRSCVNRLSASLASSRATHCTDHRLLCMAVVSRWKNRHVRPNAIHNHTTHSRCLVGLQVHCKKYHLRCAMYVKFDICEQRCCIFALDSQDIPTVQIVVQHMRIRRCPSLNIKKIFFPVLNRISVHYEKTTKGALFCSCQNSVSVVMQNGCYEMMQHMASN